MQRRTVARSGVLAAIAALLFASVGCSPTVSSTDDRPPSPLPRVPSSIVADDDNVYWSGSTVEGSNLLDVVAERPVSGGATTILASAVRTINGPYDETGLAGTWINHTHVFWIRATDSDSSIQGVRLGGGPVQTFAEHVGAYGLTVDDSDLYFTDSEGKLIAVSLTTGARRTVATGVDGCLALDDATHLLACGPLARISLTTGGVDVLGESPAAAIGSTRGEVIFQTPPCDYLDCDWGDELFIQPPNAQPEPIAKGPPYALDDEAVYCFGAGPEDTGVVRTRLDGGGSTLLVPSEAEPLGIAVNRDTVFWLERQDDDKKLMVRQAPIPR